MAEHVIILLHIGMRLILLGILTVMTMVRTKVKQDGKAKDELSR